MKKNNDNQNAISLALHKSDRGSLFVGEVGSEIPFAIKRFFIIKDVPCGAVRGVHAHKKTEQVVFCLRGEFTLLRDDGRFANKKKLTEQSPGALLRSRVWHAMGNFSEDAVLLIVASERYREADYIRDYKQFLKHVSKN